MLLALFAGCGGTNNLALTLALSGTPSGMTTTPDGFLAVTHYDNERQTRRLSAFNRSTGTLVFSNPVGPGVPVVGDDRLYILLDQGVMAFRGVAIDWRIDFDNLIPNGNSIGLTQQGVVVFGSQQGDVGAIHGVTHLGFPLWLTPIVAVPRGAPVTDGNNIVYIEAETSTGGSLYALDGETGLILWQRDDPLTPLVALEDGLIVSTEELLIRLDASGDQVWASNIIASSITLDNSGFGWASGDGLVQFELSSGNRTSTLATTCGPVTTDLIGSPWGLCHDTSTDVFQLTAANPLPTEQSDPIGVGNPIDSPILVDAIAYTLVGGEFPRLLGFNAGVQPSTGSWTRSGGKSNARRYTP